MTKGSDLAAVAAEAAEGVAKPTPEAKAKEPAAQPPEAKAPEAASAAPAPDIEALRREGATAERERLLALDVMALPGCEKIIEDAKASGQTPSEAAVAMVRHIKANGLLDISRQMAASAATVPPIEPAPHDPTGAEAASPKPKAGTEEAWRAEFAASEALQAEFGEADRYVAYQTASAGGRARIRGHKEG